MRVFLQRVGTLLGRAIDAALGLVGGLVCALAIGLFTLYLYRVTRFPGLLLLAVCSSLVLGFSVLGLVAPRYFSCFSGPVLSFFAGDGADFRDDDITWGGFVAMIGFLVGLLALLLGALFQFHVAAVVGLLLFVGYAAAVPRLLLARGEARDIRPESGSGRPSGRD